MERTTMTKQEEKKPITDLDIRHDPIMQWNQAFFNCNKCGKELNITDWSEKVDCSDCGKTYIASVVEGE